MPLFQGCFFFQVYTNVWTVLDVLAKALWVAQHFRAIDFQRVKSLHQTASPWEHPWMYRPRTRQSLRHVKTGMFLMDFDRTIYGFDVTYLSQNMMDSKTWWTASTSFLIVKGSLEGLANGHKELCKKTKDYELLLTPWVHCSSIFIFMFKLFLGVFLRDKRRVRVYTHTIAAYSYSLKDRFRWVIEAWPFLCWSPLVHLRIWLCLDKLLWHLFPNCFILCMVPLHKYMRASKFAM